MASKKKTATTADAGLQTLKIGGRVRCTDDRVEGGIVWANGVSVKITWDDGEQVTWRRDSLAGRPIEILAGDEDLPATTPAPTAESAAPESPPPAPESAQEPPAAVTPPAEPTPTDVPPATAEAAREPSTAPQAPEATTAEAPLAGPKSAQETPAAAAPTCEPTPVETPPGAAEAARETVPAEMPGSANERKRRRARKAALATAKKEPGNGKKLSAIDAAAKVLAETAAPMSCKEMVGAMAGNGYWISPGGKTPDATLCSAILREIKVKGERSRFTKAGPGRFARRDA